MKRSLYLPSLSLLVGLAWAGLASADPSASPLPSKASPATASESSAEKLAIPKLPVTQYTLENGLTVMLNQDKSLPSVAVQVVYLVGASHEEEGRTGFAHLFEHLMFQGSANFDNEYFTPFEPIGARANGTTSSDRTNYYEQIPRQFGELALWMESDRMRSLLPVLTQKKLDNQREVVKNERRQSYEMRPYGMDYQYLHEALYPKGHPYQHRPIGSHEDLSAASLEDVRTFFKKYYVANNAALIVVGDFELPEMKEQIEKYFGDITPGKRAPKPEAPRPEPTAKHWVAQDEIQLPRVYFAWTSPALFEDGDAELDLLSSMLSNGKSSRLFHSLVYDKKLAKSVDAGQWSRRLDGLYVIQATAAPGVDVNDLAAAIEAEVKTALEKPPTQVELNRARNGYKKSFYQNLEAFSDRASLIGSYFLHTGQGDQIERDFSRYLRATQEGVQRKGQELLNFEKAVRLDYIPGKKGAPVKKLSVKKEVKK